MLHSSINCVFTKRLCISDLEYSTQNRGRKHTSRLSPSLGSSVSKEELVLDAPFTYPEASWLSLVGLAKALFFVPRTMSTSSVRILLRDSMRGGREVVEE